MDKIWSGSIRSKNTNHQTIDLQRMMKQLLFTILFYISTEYNVGIYKLRKKFGANMVCLQNIAIIDISLLLLYYVFLLYHCNCSLAFISIHIFFPFSNSFLVFFLSYSSLSYFLYGLLVCAISHLVIHYCTANDHPWWSYRYIIFIVVVFVIVVQKN